ncbi:MAG TPA: serine O-acetyltransferase EpsC [Gemmatimonadales bacterium]|nr:serine O-acetyltransferase EpsC [Gemmatimonadales bacterium]
MSPTALPPGFRERLVRARAACAMPTGLRERARRFADGTLALLFPQLDPESHRDAEGLEALARELHALLASLVAQVAYADPALALDAAAVADAFFDGLPVIHASLLLDAEAHYAGDPAARSVDEVMLAYPGFRAVGMYRIANRLWRLRVPLLPRLVTELAHEGTGIDLHPGATIGHAFSIDHGTGVVVGETTVIGDRVKLYQGVTLGAASVKKELAHLKRHPTVGDDVVIYANATILGGDTYIGEGSVIGGNVWLTHSVPPGSVVTHEGVTERSRGERDALLEFHI